MEKKMVFAIILFVLLLGYYGIVKGEEDSLKAFFIIIGIVVVLWGIGTLFKDNNGLDDEDYEKIRIYEENHKDDWKGYKGTRRNSMAEDEKLRSDGIDPDDIENDIIIKMCRKINDEFL